MTKIEDLWEKIPKDVLITKERIIECIPFFDQCIEYQKLAEYLDIKLNTLTYHLNNLEKEGKIKRHKSRGLNSKTYITRKRIGGNSNS